MQLLKWIKSLFNTPSYQDHVEYFVASKQPKSTAEVEYWIRAYDLKRHDSGKEWVL